MDIRVLQYFLAVAREQTISGAAESLHLTQPTLSRQLMDLEYELGKQLLIRGNRRITLTEEGMLLRKRAEEILDLVHKTENEITNSNDVVMGDVYIGTGETDAIRILANVAKSLQKEHPHIHYHISSGDAVDVTEQLDKGLIDFGVFIGAVDLSKYNFLNLPAKDVWGVLMQRDSPLAKKDFVRPEDLWDKPLIMSRQTTKSSSMVKWLKKDPAELEVVATYSLVYNASRLVAEGLGYALTLDKLINTTGESELCFRPCHPDMEVGISIAWKKYQIFSKAAEKFLEHLQRHLEKEEHRYRSSL